MPYSFRGVDIGKDRVYTPSLTENRSERDREANGYCPHTSLSISNTVWSALSESELTAQMKFIAGSEFRLPRRVESIPIRRTLVYERIQPARIKLLICGLDMRMILVERESILVPEPIQMRPVTPTGVSGK